MNNEDVTDVVVTLKIGGEEEPAPPPVAAGVGLLLVAGLIVYAVSKRKKK